MINNVCLYQEKINIYNIYDLIEEKAKANDAIVIFEGCPFIKADFHRDYYEKLKYEKLPTILSVFCEKCSYKLIKTNNIYILKKIYRISDIPEVTSHELKLFVNDLKRDNYIKSTSRMSKITNINSILSNLSPEAILLMEKGGYPASSLPLKQKSDLLSLCYGYFLTSIDTEFNWLKETEVNLNNDNCVVDWTFFQDLNLFKTSTSIQFEGDVRSMIKSIPISNSSIERNKEIKDEPDLFASLKTMKKLFGEISVSNNLVGFEISKFIEDRNILIFGNYVRNYENVMRSIGTVEDCKFSTKKDEKGKMIYMLSPRPRKMIDSPNDYRVTLGNYIPDKINRYFDDVIIGHNANKANNGLSYSVDFSEIKCYAKIVNGFYDMSAKSNYFNKNSAPIAKMPINYRNYFNSICCMIVCEQLYTKAKISIPNSVNEFDKIVMKLTNGKENGVTVTYFSLYLPNEEGELVMISSHGSPGIKKPQ